MYLLKKLLVNPFFYAPIATILLINNWDVPISLGYGNGSISMSATTSDNGMFIELMSYAALIIFAIIFILDNFINLRPGIVWVLILPYGLWILATFAEFEYWFTLWLTLGVIYFGLFWLYGFLSKKLEVSEAFGFRFMGETDASTVNSEANSESPSPSETQNESSDDTEG